MELLWLVLTEKHLYIGIAGNSEKEDKRKANRAFRRRENICCAVGDFNKLPFRMDEVVNQWAMAKDGKTWFGINHYTGRWISIDEWQDWCNKWMRK